MLNRARSALFVSLFTFFSGFAGCATRPTVESTAKPAARVAIENPFLYSITKGGKTTYLLGSAHAGIDISQLPKWVVDAFESSTVLAAETDPVAVARFAATPQFSALAFGPGPSLSGALGAAQFATLRRRLPPELADETVLERVRPWYVFVTLLERTQREIADRKLGDTMLLDEAFLRAAAAKGKVVRGLDEPQQIFTRLSTLILPADVAEFVDIELNAVEAELARFLEAYTSGDEARLWTTVRDAIATDSDKRVMEYLLFERSASWVPKIERLHALAAERTFIVVGAGHLVGPRGLVALLRQRGYRVERVSARP